ncbi:MAG: hypothetical protein HZB25_14385 [Candidatus Eisenbacteria bacterium]|nr:hypothetical protein [Candidatus Eisenbacteria bacterium]
MKSPDVPSTARTAGILVLLLVAVALLASAAEEVPYPHGEYRGDCSMCHAEQGWKPARIGKEFDHARLTRSGFALTGAHASATCTSCHKSLEFAKQNTQCATCHQDVHRGEFGAHCARCHTARSFSDRAVMVRMHQQTRFPLAGAHAGVDCESCHPGAAQGQLRYAGARAECISCHKADFQATTAPAHAVSGLPTNCLQCHNAVAWKPAQFDHNATQFALTGQHSQALCVTCHGAPWKVTPSTDCYSCHKAKYDATATPPHQSAGLSTACATCHNTGGWAGATFNHAGTRFPLSGGHSAAQCAQCHGAPWKVSPSLECYSCHRPDFETTSSPPHVTGNLPTTCATCHTTAAWAGATFDHSVTRFPLQGSHAPVQCSQCHGTPWKPAPSLECFSCHKAAYDATKTPPHASSGIQTNCTTCHSPTAWASGTFDHATTRFALVGAHRAAQCVDCHGNPWKTSMSMDCYSCHRPTYEATKSPPHAAGGIPTNCATCHTTTAWGNGSFDHAATGFALSGSHSSVQCSNCHGSPWKAVPATDCYSCHRNRYDATKTPPHASSGIQTTCATCHTTASFLTATFDHSSTRFPLSGAHTAAQCADCHGSPWKTGMSTDCYSCHRSDYNGVTNPNHVASGFPTNCVMCHGTTAWKGSAFNHAATAFPLSGAHVATQCTQCHGSPWVARPAKDCYTCHKSNYDGTAAPPHASSGIQTNCTSCHTTASYAGGTFNHSTTPFPLTGAHVATECATCHGTPWKVGMSTDCYSCHKSNYDGTASPPHAASGIQTTCATCHNTSSYAGGTFNHSTTPFALTGAHAAVQCATCHGSPWRVGMSTDCYSCHKTTYDATKSPAHASSGLPTICATCHTTGSWTPSTFNHAATAFPLSGAHLAAQCTQCHGTPWVSKPAADCYSCHKGNYDATATPPHASSGLQTACAGCHTTAAWKPSNFNHSTTPFPLTGSHAGVGCVTCHGTPWKTGMSSDCYSCHKPDFDATASPAHVSSGFPTTCVSCHGTAAWKPSSFNHQATAFPLSGAHLATQCTQCHGSPWTAKPAADCYSCHKSNYDVTAAPPHASSGIQTNCAGCHVTAAWKPTGFNHSGTPFPLTGAHTAVQCVTCHGTPWKTGMAMDCYSCHRADYTAAASPPHVAGGLPTTCTTCHNTTSWGDGSFNHASTGFALTGAHAANTCVQCHGTPWKVGMSTDCYSCHKSKYDATSTPPHATSAIQTNCTGCNTTTAWKPGTFNHSTTPFALTGAHVAVQCATCHGSPWKVGMATDCYSCHRTDYTAAASPPHVAGGLPTTCTTCHNTTSWGDGTFNHASTGFALTGAHAANTCVQCHGTPWKVGMSTDCFACHKSKYDATTAPPHALSGIQTLCSTCHTTSGWPGGTFNHATTGFTLVGSHTTTACVQCHGAPWRVSPSTDCYACHRADYDGTTSPPHASSGIPTTCATCHSPTSWGGGSFSHSTTAFPLTGSHVTATCVQCHGTPWVVKPSKDCYACHVSNYNASTSPAHRTAGFPTTCTSCHNTTAWAPSTFNHDSRYFPIYSGKHLNRWAQCSDCHTVATNFAVFSCFKCHAQTVTNSHHTGVSGYRYDSAACYSCHPRGSS